MGSTYDNALVTAPIDRVLAAVSGTRLSGLAAAAGPELTVLYPAGELDAERLSRDLDAAVLTAVVFDSDVLDMRVIAEGRIVHRYVNSPGYFAEGVREVDGVREALVSREDGETHWIPMAPSGIAAEPFLRFAVGEPDVEALLTALSDRCLDPEDAMDDGGYIFANHQHFDAMAALGLPARLLNTGYDYLSRADVPGDDYSVFVPFGSAVRPEPTGSMISGLS